MHADLVHSDANIRVASFLPELKRRNPLLYYFGWSNFLFAIVCIFLMFIDERQVGGINTWIKPLKFFISIGVFTWTISWFLIHLHKQRTVKTYSIVVIITLLIEMVLISYQAARGVKSHFNVSSAMDAFVLSIMGMSILVFTLWTFYITILFMRKPSSPFHDGYTWGIRLGLLFFVIFAFQGGLMASMLRHTIGSEDGQPGYPVLNWSRNYGDLRVAHLFGMHALQLLPFAGYFIFKTKTKIIIFSLVYFLIVSFLLFRALRGMPLF